MSLISRVTGIFKAEANHAVDQAENPVLMTEQAIRDLEENYKKAVNAEVQLKTIVIEKRTTSEKKQNEANEWGHKANLLLDKVATKELSEADADRLAGEALSKQTSAQTLADKYKVDADAQQKSLDGVNSKVVELKTLIDETKAHLEDLKARETTAEVSVEVNKQLSDLDGLDNTKALLKRMEEKTAHLENQAAAYSELQHDNRTPEDEINAALLKSPPTNNALEELKKKRAETETK